MGDDLRVHVGYDTLLQLKTVSECHTRHTEGLEITDHELDYGNPDIFKTVLIILLQRAILL